MKRALLALSLALATGLASPAHAESRRRGSFELGAGTYRPDIDSDFASPGPYREVFGGGRGWQFRAGISRAVYSGFGSLELGFRTGFFQDQGRGLALVQEAGQPDRFEPSGDRTQLNVVPTSLMATYRFDVLTKRYDVPLAPYARVSLERLNWWVTDGGGDWSERGATNGWSMTGGLALLLDFFDRGLARELDADTGVNDTYLFFDVTKSFIDDFGSSSSWDLSDESLTLTGGLMFVF